MWNPSELSWSRWAQCSLMHEGLWLAIGLGVLGLLVGSFLNVVIARVPQGKSIVMPASSCPRCGAQLLSRDNIPVLSWLLLRGRCRSCREPIAVRYPLVEAGNAVLWLTLCWWAIQEPGRTSLLPLLLILSSAGLALAMIDIEHHRLPDAIVLPLYPVTAIGLLLCQLIDSQGHWPSAVVGAMIWALVIGGLWLLTAGRGMGRGDAKLAPVLGAVTGWMGVAIAGIGLMTAFALGAIAGLVLILAGRRGRQSRLAFGPFMLIGTLFAVLFGQVVWDLYSHAIGL